MRGRKGYGDDTGIWSAWLAYGNFYNMSVEAGIGGLQIIDVEVQAQGRDAM